MPAIPALPEGAAPLLLALAALAAGALLAALVAWGLARHARRLRAEAEAARAASDTTLREAFQSLSVDVLHKNSQIFLEQARASLGEYQKGASSELERRQQAIDTLVAPIRESLAQLGEKLSGIEKERHGHYSALTQQLRQVSADHAKLSSETSNLVRAMRSAPSRGRWGELQLRRVVELAGMLAHCDFVEQEAVGAERRLRPDLVVRLPGGKSVVVDAKAPLEAYLDAHEAADEGAREVKLKEHARQVRAHVSALSRQGLLVRARRRAGLRGDVPPRRAALRRRAPVRRRARRVRRREAGGDREPDDAHRLAAHRRLRLAAGAHRRGSAADQRPRPRALRPPRPPSAATSSGWAATSTRPSAPTTTRSATSRPASS